MSGGQENPAAVEEFWPAWSDERIHDALRLYSPKRAFIT
jgi:hypothetical protein